MIGEKRYIGKGKNCFIHSEYIQKIHFSLPQLNSLSLTLIFLSLSHTITLLLLLSLFSSSAGTFVADHQGKRLHQGIRASTWQWQMEFQQDYSETSCINNKN